MMASNLGDEADGETQGHLRNPTEMTDSVNSCPENFFPREGLLERNPHKSRCVGFDSFRFARR